MLDLRGRLQQGAGDAPLVDTGEMVYISSLALLKMLKHGTHPRSPTYCWPSFKFLRQPLPSSPTDLRLPYPQCPPCTAPDAVLLRSTSSSSSSSQRALTNNSGVLDRFANHKLEAEVEVDVAGRRPIPTHRPRRPPDFSLPRTLAHHRQFDLSHMFSSRMAGRAGVPMEVMGLMLGEFVDDYTVQVIDVFAMPQSGTVRTPSLASICPSVRPSARPYHNCPIASWPANEP